MESLDTNKSQFDRQVVRLEKLDLKEISSLTDGELKEVCTQLEEVVLKFNFDTFSFIFELLDKGSTNETSLVDTFNGLRFDSLALAEKYGGSNCAGLSIAFCAVLPDLTDKLIIIPSFGDHLITKSADEYAEVRTSAILALVRGTLNAKIGLLIAPGLTIGKPLVVQEDFSLESFRRQYCIKNVSSNEFELIAVRNDGSLVTRRFFMCKLSNLDESLQKNMLRTRTKYQITRQHKGGTRDSIRFNFKDSMFDVRIAGGKRLLSTEEFKHYVEENGEKLEHLFENPHLTTGFLRFIRHIDDITDQLLLPDIKAIIES